MDTKIVLDLLTKDSVSVLVITTMNYNNKKIEVERTRKTYSNSILGREQLLNDIGEPYYTAVMAIWENQSDIEIEE